MFKINIFKSWYLNMCLPCYKSVMLHSNERHAHNFFVFYLSYSSIYEYTLL